MLSRKSRKSGLRRKFKLENVEMKTCKKWKMCASTTFLISETDRFDQNI